MFREFKGWKKVLNTESGQMALGPVEEVDKWIERMKKDWFHGFEKMELSNEDLDFISSKTK